MDIQDLSARNQALEVENSFLIQAPAGSGKTELLIQRYLSLLSKVQKPEQILAMTFTRKAAAEMRNRIFNALERGKDSNAPLKDHERFTWTLAKSALKQNHKMKWGLLNNPARLRIQTIDSFCASLTKQIPLLTETGSSLTVQEDSSLLYLETARLSLDLIEKNNPEGEKIRSILKRLDNSKEGFIKRFFQLLQKRDQWMINFSENWQESPNKTDQEALLKEIIESDLKECHSAFPKKIINDLPPLAAYCGNNLYLENPDDPRSKLKDTQSFPEPTCNNLNIWKGLGHLLLTNHVHKFRKPGGVNKTLGFPSINSSIAKKNKESFQEILESLQENHYLEKTLFEVTQLPDPEYSLQDWKFLETIWQVFPILSNTLRCVFKENGLTDFSELALSAIKALGSDQAPTDLLLKLDMQIHHILVDEFQDTSFKQLELLKKLTLEWMPEEWKTLFIVGDPMQSIFRFRDAEVGLFLKIRDEGINNINLKYLQLTSNFRSQKGIVNWVNDCFTNIFPENDDPDRGAIAFKHSTIVNPELESSPVLLNPIISNNNHEEALKIIDTLNQIKLKSSKDSIAILVRARPHLLDIVSELKKSGIPYQAEDIDPLTRRPEIIDLLSLLRALMDPMDKLAWLSILRAPWCGLTLGDLLILCNQSNDIPIWILINSNLSKLSQDGQQRIHRLIQPIQKAKNYCHSSNLREILEGVWIALGGPACIPANTIDDVNVFFDKVDEILSKEGLKGLINIETKLENLFASPKTGDEIAIKIMTMHKAKGLEFDHVLLPGLGKQPRREEKRLLHWLTHGDHLLLAPIHETGEKESAIYNYLNRLNNDRNYHEIKRLLYVATTRAKKYLYLFGHTNTDKDGNFKPQSGSLLSHLWPFISEKWQAETPTSSNNVIPIEPKEKTIFLRRLSNIYSLPDPFKEIKTDFSSELVLDDEPDNLEKQPIYEWVGYQSRSLGIILHRCFKEMGEMGLDQWKESYYDKIEDKIVLALQGEGLSYQEAITWAQKGKLSIKASLNDETAKWIFKKHKDNHSEYALSFHKNNVFTNKIIDRTFIDESNVRWIIDFKTGEHLGTDIENFLERECQRHRPQLEQYENMIRLRGETLPIRKALYFPLYQRLVEILPNN